MSLPNIETLDADGAIREAEEAVAGDNRAAFFRKAAIGGGAVLGSGAIMGMLPNIAMGAASPKQDLEILNYALTLEYLEAAFYTEAVEEGDISGDAKAFARLVGKHERVHVKTLKSVINQLGGKPVKEPKFNFKGTNKKQNSFIETALVLENTGVHAYLGQVKRLNSKALATAAGTIVTVEARHAAAIAFIAADNPLRDNKSSSITPDGAFDVPFSMKKVLKAVGDTGFIKG
jgi:rubrerythrin